MRYPFHAVMGPRLEFMEFVLSCSEDERARFIRRVCWTPPAQLDTYFGWVGDAITSIDKLWALEDLDLIHWCIANAEPEHGMPRGIEERRYQPEDEQINASIPFPVKNLRDYWVFEPCWCFVCRHADALSRCMPALFNGNGDPSDVIARWWNALCRSNVEATYFEAAATIRKLWGAGGLDPVAQWLADPIEPHAKAACIFLATYHSRRDSRDSCDRALPSVKGAAMPDGGLAEMGGLGSPHSRLRVNKDAREARWGSNPLAINGNADFEILQALHDGRDKVVSYRDLLCTLKPDEISDAIGAMSEAPPEVKLLCTLKPDEISDAIGAMSEAPPEVKEAVKHIRRAFRAVCCPWLIKNVSRNGYRLVPPE